MSDAALLLIVGSAGTAGIAIASAAALRGWRDWLDVRRMEVDGGRPAGTGARGGRIELADLKARIRRLEAIANGGDG